VTKGQRRVLWTVAALIVLAFLFPLVHDEDGYRYEFFFSRIEGRIQVLFLIAEWIGIAALGWIGYRLTGHR